MSTLICAGGSGTRVLESVLHLCAAGLGPPTLRVLIIDPDTANGNGSRCTLLLNKYAECAAAFGGKCGSLPFFRTQLDLLETQNGDAGLKMWSPVGANQSFGHLLNYPLLQKREQDVVHLFFTDPELEMQTKVGFLGHAAVGAASMALLSLYRNQKPWNQLAEKIRSEVTQTEGSTVVIAGSVFGGTGASTMYPLTRFLRRVPQQNPEKLKIAAIALAPYFQFRASTRSQSEQAQDLAAKSEWFALATRSAAQFYHHLRENGDWDFDAMYWLGDDCLAEVEYSEGGSKQANPAHFIDFLGAVACLDFFNNPVSSHACYFAGPQVCEEEQLRAKNVLRWSDIPVSNLERETLLSRLLQFWLTGAAHTGFFEHLFKDGRIKADRIEQEPYCVPWYFERFTAHGQRLTAPENRRPLTLLSEFFRGWHFPWWHEIHSLELDRIRLFNRLALTDQTNSGCEVDMFRLANLVWPDRPSQVNKLMVDRLFSDTVEISDQASGDTPAATYLALLGAAAGRFIQREYKKKEGPDARQ